MANTLLLFIGLVFGGSVAATAQAGDLTNIVLLELLKDGSKVAKNDCDMGAKNNVTIAAFIASYINWTYSSKSLDTKSLTCTESNSKKGFYACHFRYGEKAKVGGNPGWDMNLNFNYSSANGIDWKSVQCVAVP